MKRNPVTKLLGGLITMYIEFPTLYGLIKIKLGHWLVKNPENLDGEITEFSGAESSIPILSIYLSGNPSPPSIHCYGFMRNSLWRADQWKKKNSGLDQIILHSTQHHSPTLRWSWKSLVKSPDLFCLEGGMAEVKLTLIYAQCLMVWLNDQGLRRGTLENLQKGVQGKRCTSRPFQMRRLKVFVYHVNAHQRVTSSEDWNIKWRTHSVMPVSYRSGPSPSHLSLPNALMNTVAAAAVKEIMHVLSKVDFHSVRPIWLTSLLRD